MRYLWDVIKLCHTIVSGLCNIGQVIIVAISEGIEYLIYAVAQYIVLQLPDLTEISGR